LSRSIVPTPVTFLATLLAGAGSALLVPAPAQAAAGADLKLAATNDAYTSSGRRTTVFGQQNKLVVGLLDGDTKISYLTFVVPAGARVTGSHLDLSTNGAVSGPIRLSRVLDTSWSEKTLTSANAPAIGLALGAPAVRGSVLSFNLGGEIAGPGTYSFAVQSAAGAVTRFRSAEDVSGRPVLTVNTTAAPPVRAPVPTTTDTSPPAPSATPSATPAPSTAAPSTAAPSVPGTSGCVTGALLVPSCGVLWGAAAGGFTAAPRDQALLDWERLSGRTATIFHAYHKGDELFPTRSEIAMASDPAHPRVLLLNWKVAYGSTWAKVASGALDQRIDAFAARVKTTFPQKFFLVLNHEPENDVIARSGSGMEARDFAAMYRHTILRLRALGVTNVVNVLAYMGNEKWMAQSWWADLYPGDDVVDWMGLDSYVSAAPGYHHGMFADLLDRRAPSGPSFYDWAVANHGSKPMMIAEWGVYNSVGHPVDKSAQFASVRPELAKRPQIKAIVYFDTKHDDQGDRDISIDNTAGNLAAFRRLAASPLFDVRIGG
jgi:beta-mannanase